MKEESGAISFGFWWKEARFYRHGERMAETEREKSI